MPLRALETLNMDTGMSDATARQSCESVIDGEMVCDGARAWGQSLGPGLACILKVRTPGTVEPPWEGLRHTYLVCVLEECIRLLHCLLSLSDYSVLTIDSNTVLEVIWNHQYGTSNWKWKCFACSDSHGDQDVPSSCSV